MSSEIRARADEQDGAVAVVVAICLLALVAVGALAVDLGSAWETKRDFVTDTDAAALAATRALVDSNCDHDVARDAATSLLSANQGSAPAPADYSVNVLDCSTVNVVYTGQAQTTFAGAVGQDELAVLSSSTATAPTTSVGGLRPITVCWSHPDISAWIAGGAGATIDLVHDKTSETGDGTDCGSAPGNWGWTCFDKDEPRNATGPGGCGGNDGSINILNMLMHGYSGDVDLGAAGAGDEDCAPDEPGNQACEQTTGSLGNGIAAGLSHLASTGETFPILAYGSMSGTGSNAVTAPVAFITVRLVEYRVTGTPSGRYFRLELVGAFENGSVYSQTGTTTIIAPVRLCDVDHNTASSFC